MDVSKFYNGITPFNHFADAVNIKSYRPLPDHWVVAVSDVVGSTKAIHEGRYKTVNMAGAALITALMNAFGGQEFPFIFGGDGAAAAFPSRMAEDAAAAMMATRVWVEEELDLRLRVGLIGVGDIRKGGSDVLIARYRASPEASYAMFAGGGVAWAESELKAGRIGLPDAPPGTRPDLSGLSCRWAPIGAKSGVILSVLAEPVSSAAMVEFVAVVEEVLDLLSTSPRNGHPVPADGPEYRWPARGANLEVTARKAEEGSFTARRKIWFESLLGLVLDRTGLSVGGFDMRRYRRVVSRNSDYRKFDDGLRLTVDVEETMADRIEALLLAAEAKGVMRCGFTRQDAALMTCIVPSYTSDNHLHFIDGAGGGYASASIRLKEKRENSKPDSNFG